MTYSASVISAMIASPSDVNSERALARSVIHEWNDIHARQRKQVILPLGWETNITSSLDGQAQELINTEIVDNSDIMIGIFWTRIGSATKNAESGTVEEITRHFSSKKPAMIYFSNAPVAPAVLDKLQYERLMTFKDWCKNNGLIRSYDDASNFRQIFSRELTQLIYSKFPINDTSLDTIGKTYNSISISLSNEAVQLLKAAVGAQGAIMDIKYIGGRSIQAGDTDFTNQADHRTIARWEAALKELERHEMIQASSFKRDYFTVTSEGYSFADTIRTG